LAGTGGADGDVVLKHPSQKFGPVEAMAAGSVGRLP